MAVSTDSALVRFTIGDFSEPTTLTIPTEAEEDKLTLRITEEISSQLTGWGDTPLDIYILLDVKFNGDDWYKNSQYDAPSSSLAPTDPDLTIDVDDSSGIVESVTVNNYVPLVKDTSGNIVNGTYTVNARFVYWAFDTAFAGSITTFTAALNYEKLIPIPVYSYDTYSDNPFLQLSDNQDYIVNGAIPEIDEEFVLYPPQNKAAITTVTDNQSIKFSSYWTGGNELKITTLLTYTLTTYEIITLQSAYDSFTLYNINNCAIFACLNSLYDKYKASTCGTKQNAIYEQQLLEATSIAIQIYTGRGCNQPTLTELLNDFEELCGCSCNCIEDEVINIGAPNVVLQLSIQEVNATETTTVIDLSEGSTVFLTLATAGTTEVQVSNITQYATYQFIITRAFSTQEATFGTGVFEDGNGDAISATPLLDNKIILEFFATTSSTLTLKSRND